MLIHTGKTTFDFHFCDVVGLQHLLGIHLVLVLFPHDEPAQKKAGSDEGKQTSALPVRYEGLPCQVGERLGLVILLLGKDRYDVLLG